MKLLLCTIVASLVLCAAAGVAQPAGEQSLDLFLKTDAKWIRTDYYGVDRNDNGIIDASEWKKVRSSGSGSPPPWGRYKLRPGETHRWEISTQEKWEEKLPSKKRGQKR